MSTGRAPRHGKRKSGNLQAAAVSADSCAAAGVSQASHEVPGRQQPSKLQRDHPSRRLSWLLLTSLLGVVLLAICVASPIQAWLSEAVTRLHHSPSDSRPSSDISSVVTTPTSAPAAHGLAAPGRHAASPGPAAAPSPAPPSSGIFPAGCKWRDAPSSPANVSDPSPMEKFWAVRQYQYWHPDQQAWLPEQPAACTVRGAAVDHGQRSWGQRRSPRTEVSCTTTHCIYENLWYNNGRFFLLVDGPEPVTPWKMTRNQDLNVLHVDSAAKWADSLKALRRVTGDTLVFDFVYFLHPTAIGHWSEMMFPLFSILRLEPHFAKPPQQFILLHLKRHHLMDWVRAVISVTLGVKPKHDLPPMIMQQETNSVWTQIPSPLENFRTDEWVFFERALVVRDIFTGGVRTFLSSADAKAFRALIYTQHGLAPPQPGKPLPRVITVQRKRANRRIVNEDAFLDLLREYAPVQVVEFNSTTSFKEQLQIISETGVFISVHTSNLANAQFLPPGAAVIELIQRNWIWHNLDKSFQVQTEMMGDLHHYAWRARHRNQTVYIHQRDAERFGNWTSEQCSTEDCVEAHTNVDVIVDLDEFRALLDSRLPLVWGGSSVHDAALPWPDHLQRGHTSSAHDAVICMPDQ